MAVRGVAVRIGVEPNTELFKEQIKLNDQGFALVTSDHETDVTNVFAIGDVCNPLAPTISTAGGDGARAAKVIASRLQQKTS
jgi:thioredoxin reductase (NADPH)